MILFSIVPGPIFNFQASAYFLISFSIDCRPVGLCFNASGLSLSFSIFSVPIFSLFSPIFLLFLLFSTYGPVWTFGTVLFSGLFLFSIFISA
jgi:hypothetical protein